MIIRQRGEKVPNVDLIFRENGEFITRNSSELFNGKRVILFSLPGAFTPTCSSTHLPTFEQKYDEFINEYNIDDIYCISVNDAFVMNAWAENLGIEKVKMIPDGNYSFTNEMGALVSKHNLGFGFRSWRYSALIDNGIIQKIFIEPGIRDQTDDDPFEVSDAYTMLDYVRKLQPSMALA